MDAEKSKLIRHIVDKIVDLTRETDKHNHERNVYSSALYRRSDEVIMYMDDITDKLLKTRARLRMCGIDLYFRVLDDDDGGFVMELEDVVNTNNSDVTIDLGSLINGNICVDYDTIDNLDNLDNLIRYDISNLNMNKQSTVTLFKICNNMLKCQKDSVSYPYDFNDNTICNIADAIKKGYEQGKEIYTRNSVYHKNYGFDRLRALVKLMKFQATKMKMDREVESLNDEIYERVDWLVVACDARNGLYDVINHEDIMNRACNIIKARDKVINQRKNLVTDLRKGADYYYLFRHLKEKEVNHSNEKDSLVEIMVNQMKSINPKLSTLKFKDLLDKRTDKELEVLAKRIDNTCKVQSKLRSSGIIVDVRSSFKSKDGMIMKIYSVHGLNKDEKLTFDCGCIDNGDILLDKACIDNSEAFFDVSKLNFDRQIASNLLTMTSNLKNLAVGNGCYFDFSSDAYDKILNSLYKIWTNRKNNDETNLDEDEENSILYCLEELLELHDIMYKASDTSKKVNEGLCRCIDDIIEHRYNSSIYTVYKLPEVVDDWFNILKSNNKQVNEKKALLHNFRALIKFKKSKRSERRI